MIGYSLPPSCVGTDHKQILESFRCPLSLQIFKEPVLLLGDGRTYERDLIGKWLTDHNTSPITREHIATPHCAENRSFKELVNEFLALYPEIQFSDAQYLCPAAVVEFHNALLGYIPSEKGSLKKTTNTTQEILQHVSSLLESEPRLVLISFESQQEKISCFQFACKHASEEIINMLFDRLKRIYKINQAHCKGIFKGVLRGKFVGLVKQALKNPKLDDYEMLKVMGISANFMFLTAASALDIECIARSLERGASVTVKGKNGFSALMEAVVHMNAAAVPYLAETCELPVKPAIPYAFLYRNDEILEYFLKRKVTGIPSLHLLLNKEYYDEWGRDRIVDLMKKIIDNSSKDGVPSGIVFQSIDALDPDQWTALYVSIQSGLPDFTKILLQLGANPAASASNTPLHLAAKLGDETLMKDLVEALQKPQDINVENSDGDTPLDLAIENKHNHIMKLLLTSPKCSVNVNMSTFKDMAIVNPDTMQILLRRRLRAFSLLGNGKKS